MRSGMRLTLLLVLTVTLAAGCGGDGDAEAEGSVADDIATTSTTVTTTAATTTTMPTITAAPELLRIAPGSLAGNFRLEVLEGDYQVESGATLRAGSSLLNIPEELLRFYEGLRIDVAEEVTLGGETSPAGSQLIVSAAGEFVER